MPEDRPEVFQVLLRTLDILEVIIRDTHALNPSERDKLSEYNRQITQIISVTGEASVSMTLDDASSHVGGDYSEGDLIKQQAGGDMKGVAAGKNAQAHYAEVDVSLRTFDDLVTGIDQIASDVGASELAWNEKATVLSALAWWSEHAKMTNMPIDAPEHLSKLQVASKWVKDRINELLSSATGAVAGHWAVELVKNIL